MLEVIEQMRHHLCIIISYEWRLGEDNRLCKNGTVTMVVWLRILATFERRSCCISCIQQCAKPCCITVCHAVTNAKETAVMKGRDTILCMHGSAKQSVPGGGRGRSSQSDPATAGNGKGLFNITGTGDQSITLVILCKCTSLNSSAAGVNAVRRNMSYAVSLHLMMHV
jgi:hypothetical protein